MLRCAGEVRRFVPKDFDFVFFFLAAGVSRVFVVSAAFNFNVQLGV
jgi:hypothetical protein